jgi:hypothetical protein
MKTDRKGSFVDLDQIRRRAARSGDETQALALYTLV